MLTSQAFGDQPLTPCLTLSLLTLWTLQSFIAHRSDAGQKLTYQKEAPDYDLIATANHHGSVYGGHYT